MRKDTKFVFNRKRSTVIRYVKETYPNGLFLGHLLRNGNVDLITRPENWSDVRGELKVSFTGTRGGMADGQMAALDRVLSTFQPALFVHGDCLGADFNAHRLILTINASADHQIAINTYPSNLEKTRAYTGEEYEVCEPLPPLERNPLIVDAGQLLIACPAGVSELIRSGTWATIRAARRTDRLVIAIDTAGRIYNISQPYQPTNISFLFEQRRK